MLLLKGAFLLVDTTCILLLKVQEKISLTNFAFYSFQYWRHRRCYIDVSSGGRKDEIAGTIIQNYQKLL